MIVWNEQFETGLATIDEQHRELIDRINKLGKLLHCTNPTWEEVEFIIQLVEYLETYADTHFQYEEGCMARHRCPAHAHNQQAHQSFRNFFKQHKEQCKKDGFQLEILRNLHQVTTNWIQEHILRIDTQLKPCIKN